LSYGSRVRALAIVGMLAATASAGPDGPHPRMLLGDVRTHWQAQAKLEHGPVVGAIALCDDARTTREHDRAVYQGSEWTKVLQACLVAWAATDGKQHAQTAIKYMTALLDDLDEVGDDKGGDTAAQRDSGYAIRNLGPYTALAYDWLYDQLSPQLRAKARARWKAWLAWYAKSGYRAGTPGSNYHAGYLLSATTIAIAEAGEPGADALWRDVTAMWTKDMAAAFGEEGVLAGGDWPEGWQYGPLSVAEIALGARLMRAAGVDVPGASHWLTAVLRHHVYSLSPSDRMFAGADAEPEVANLEPGVLGLDAVALGDATPDDKRWARGELSRLALVDRDWLLYDALAGVGDKPVLPPRAQWPTWYVATGTGTLFARTRWDDQAMWFVVECHATIDTDHRHPDAGNFVLSRGKDDVIADPSPYGTQSTLTSNAPTVASAHLPNDYIPSQGYWSERTGFDFATQRASGLVAARCDYADQYKFQDRKSDVPMARRDLVMVPANEGRDAIVVVIDRADTGAAKRGMYLRFRTPGKLALAGATATATVGASKLVVSGDGKPTIGTPTLKDCFKDGTVRGTCDAARFPVTDYRVEIAGPTPSAVHVIAAVDAKAGAPATTPLSGEGWAGVALPSAAIVWRAATTDTFSYRAPAGVTHVVFDAPEKDGKATVVATLDGKDCAVTVTAGGDTAARPVIVKLDAQCKLAADAEAPASSALGTRPSRSARSPRSGCCGAQAAPGSSFAMSVVVFAFVVRRRRR
jgi:hypothetical protein